MVNYGKNKTTWADIKSLSKEERKAQAIERNKEARAVYEASVEAVQENGVETPNGYIDVAEALARLNANSPCAKYSWDNTLQVLAHDTIDARTYLGWKQVGRNVKKGTKGFPILAPVMFKTEQAEQTDGVDNDTTNAIGFKFVTLFRYEDTEGKELDYTPIGEAEQCNAAA